MSRPPVRVQLRRTRGWRMPADTVKIDRTTKWGNPFIVEKVGMVESGDRDDEGQPIMIGPWRCIEKGAPDFVDGWHFPTKAEALGKSVDLYRLHLGRSLDLQAAALDELRWKNLACWCGEGEPCHGDELLKVANRKIKP
ncbi:MULTISPECIES: DUF4326 domain-containing protein [unclassified Sphingobium]|uniref:DUF4326 domain-containing protein n=1 Tax=unclassified Sphingobium TaxID=2611147 RepID=UPI002223FD01|nr:MULTISPECIES: DUF4326 domain-containing protein [unclassified Sphingobium]MCW2395869.1 hypothetical protein [Sphingobium sp. B8D3B]MCW2419385.1 hypothetical protein [Sphingobium sp. B8D3C]